MQCMCVEDRIAASAQVVYDIVSDLPGYGAWNPWTIHCDGETGHAVREGAIFRVKVWLNGRMTTARHRVIEMKPGRCFTWCDVGWFTPFAYGERTRRIENMGPDQTHVCIELRITGPLSGLAAHLYGDSIRSGMASEIAALKRHAERQSTFGQT